MRTSLFVSLLSLAAAATTVVACGGETSSPRGDTGSPSEGSTDNGRDERGPTSDSPNVPSGPDGHPECTYRTVTGIATVVSLDANVDNETVGTCYRATTDVVFTFASDDPTATTDAPGTTYSLWVGSSAGAPTSCIEPAGLKVGATFAIIRTAPLTSSDTCRHVVFELPATSTARVCACTPCDGSANTVPGCE